MLDFSFLPAYRRLALALPLAGLLAHSAQAQVAAAFAPPVAYSVLTGATSIDGNIVADLNGDGQPDVVAVSASANLVGVALGKSPANGGGFEPPQQYSTGANTFPRGVRVADVNNDGLPDLITANPGTSSVGVLLAKSPASGGGFEPPQQYRTEPQLASGVYAVAVGDVNGDGLPDLVAANNRTNSAGVLLGKSAASGGGFQPVQIYSTGTNSFPVDIELADFNGDGLLDVVTAGMNTDGVAVLYGKSAANGGGFQYSFYSTGGPNFDFTYPRDVEVNDLNNDGLPDIITANTNNKMVGVLMGRGAIGGGGFEPPKEYSTLSFYVYKVAVADVNGDGLKDIITDNIGVFPGRSVANGDGFAPVQFITPAGGGSYIRAADVNGDGRPDLLSGGVAVRLNTSGAPTLASLSLTSTLVGTSLTLTGTNLDRVTAVSFNGTAAPFTVVNSTTITTTVPAGATSGPVTVTSPAPFGVSNGLAFTVTSTDLVINGTQTIPVGAYNSITLNGPGVGTLIGPVTVASRVVVNDGATLNDGCNVISGPGSFTLAAGGTLSICAAAGISGSGATGTVQLTGARSYSPDASYVYAASVLQSTGDGLPGRVRNLTTTNRADLTLTAPTSVAQVLTIGGAGYLRPNGNALTLLSSASGTALVVNSSTGTVIGGVTVQRYLDPSLNPGLGYRHLASPVTNSYVGDLVTAGFAPVLNPAYNTAAKPALERPFPTVFGYDETRLASTSNDLATFDKGFFSPAALADPLVPGRGYAVNVAGTELVDFNGSLHNGDLRVSLTRSSGTPVAQTGWALLGNPYAAPLDYRLVTSADRSYISAAFYVYQSTGQYAGQYRSYVNGIGSSPLIASGQGFFVQLATGQSTGTFTFRNAQRVTSYASQATFQRPAIDPRPQVQLALSGAGLRDELVAYVEAGATPAFDAAFDATKLPNSTGLNLSSFATSGESLSIDARPAFAAATVLPLAVGVPAPGSYALSAADLANLPAGLDAFLADDLAGQVVKLNVGTSYSFSVAASQAAALITGRFRLLFRPATALATAPALSAESVSVYPNPARERFTVVLPGLGQATTVQAELLNALGQVVRRQTAALPATGTQLTIEAAGLAAGVYTLRLQAGTAALAKRLVVR